MSISMSEYPVSLADRTGESSRKAERPMRSPEAMPSTSGSSTKNWKPMPMHEYLAAINQQTSSYAAPSWYPSLDRPPPYPGLDTGRLPVASPSVTPQMQERCKEAVSAGIPRPLPALPPGMPMSQCVPVPGMIQAMPTDVGSSAPPNVLPSFHFPPPRPPNIVSPNNLNLAGPIDSPYAKLVVASPQPIHARQKQPLQLTPQTSEPSSPETPVLSNSGYLSPPPGPRPLPAVPSPPPLLAPTPLRVAARPAACTLRPIDGRDPFDNDWKVPVEASSSSPSRSNTPKLANPTERVRFSHARSRSDQSQMFRDDMSIRPKSIRRRQSFTSNITDLSYASDSDETDTGYDDEDDVHRTLGDMGILSSPVSDRTIDSPLHHHPREVDDEGAHPIDVSNDDAMTEFAASPMNTRPLSTLVFSATAAGEEDFDNGYSPFSSRSGSPISPIRYAPQADSDEEIDTDAEIDGAGSDADSDVSSIMFGDNPSPTSGSPVESPTSPIRLPTRARRRKSYSASTRSRRSLSPTRREVQIPRRRVQPSARRSHSVGSRDDLSFTARRASAFSGLRDDFGGRYAGSSTFRDAYDTPSTASTQGAQTPPSSEQQHQPLLAPVRAPDADNAKVGPPSSFMKFAPALMTDSGIVAGGVMYVSAGKTKTRGRASSRDRGEEDSGERSKERDKEKKEKKRGRGVMGLPMGLGGREKEGRDRSTSGAQAPQPPAHIGPRVAAQIHAMESAVYRGETQDGQDGIHYSPDAVQYVAGEATYAVDADGYPLMQDAPYPTGGYPAQYPTQSLPGIKYSPRHAVSRSRSGLSIDTAHSAGSSVESWQDSRRYGSREELFRQNNKDDMLRVVNR